MLDDLCLHAVRPRWADFTDAGPGVGVSNYDASEMPSWQDFTTRTTGCAAIVRGETVARERQNGQILPLRMLFVDGATLDWERVKRFDDLSKEQISKMSLPEFEKYERQHMAKNAWYVSEQIAKQIDDEPVLKEYIHSHLSETSEELFFFNRPYIDSYRDVSEKTKDKVPGSSYIRKIESFVEKHYVRGELLVGFNRGSCKVGDLYNELCEWCSVNRWVAPAMEGIPQLMPDSERAGHYLDVFETPRHYENGRLRKPDDCLPRKNLKDLFDQKETGLEQPEAIKKFSQEFYVEEKQVNDYLRHCAREKEKDKEKEYKDFSWSDIINDGKLSKLRFREFDLYLTQHGLNTTGLKPDR